MNRIKDLMSMLLALLILPVVFTLSLQAEISVLRQTLPVARDFNFQIASVTNKSQFLAKQDSVEAVDETGAIDVEQESSVEDLEALVSEVNEEEQQVTPQTSAHDEVIERIKRALKAAEEQKQKEEEAKKNPKKGEEIQKTMKPVGDITAPVQPIQGNVETAPSGANATSATLQLPPMCDSLGKIFAAINKIEKEKAQGGIQEVKKFFAEINHPEWSCGDLLSKLQTYTDLSKLADYPEVMFPGAKEIITNRNDARLNDYGLGFGRPFRHWSEQLLGKELKTYGEFEAALPILKSHVQYLQIPPDRPDLKHLEPVIESIKQEAPEMVQACFDQAWRFSPDIKLCQWADAKDIPIWVAMWANATIWGVYFDLEKVRDSKVLVVWLPKTKEYVFWAGPCGGNGAWIPSAPLVKFTSNVENVYDRCEKIESPGARLDTSGNIVLARGQSQTLNIKRLLPQEKIDELQKEGRLLSKWQWQLNGQPLASVPMSSISSVISQPGTYSVVNTSYDPSNPLPNEDPVKACSVKVVQPNPKAYCETLSESSITSEGIVVPFRFDDQAGLVKRVDYLFNNQLVSPDLVQKRANGVVLPISLIQTKGDQYINVRLVGFQEEILDECPGQTTNKVTVPEARCDALVLNQKGTKVTVNLRYTETVKITDRVDLVAKNVSSGQEVSLGRYSPNFTFDANKVSGAGKFTVLAIGYDRMGREMWRCPGEGQTFEKPCPKCEGLTSSQKKQRNKDINQRVIIVPQVVGDRSQIESAIWTDSNGKPVPVEMVNSSNFQLSFNAGDLLPTVLHKGQLLLKIGSYAFTLTIKCKDGTISECKIILKVGGGGLWKWILLGIFITGAIVAIILLSGGAATAIVTKVPVIVTGV